MSRPAESFEQFYLNKVALGEGCGCAEMIVPVHDQDRGAAVSRTAGGGRRLRGAATLKRLAVGIAAVLRRAAP